ncbi:MAG: hypothetical protein AAFR64_07315 [Pseudomonadota bacterium]
MDHSRYEGKPFLKFLDCFVLDAIDELDHETCDRLTEMEPKLEATFGTTGGWRGYVSQTMQFPEDLPSRIAQIWREGSVRMREGDMEPDPIQFTHQFVDTNFPTE